ncbi:MAG: hypothetical protein ACM3ML_38095 [Micromonosporaceae bacterium]
MVTAGQPGRAGQAEQAGRAAHPGPATGGLPHAGEPAGAPARRLPPIATIAVASMMFVIAGGIYVAAYLPRHAPLGPAVALLAAAGAALVANIVSLSRLGEFAWDVFYLVGRWALAAYAIVAGMLEYVFVIDHTRGGLLLVMTLMLVVFAVNVPILLAFSVARYQPARPRPDESWPT